MALRATKGDEKPHRPDGIRPQDAILPHKLCRRPVVFDRAGGLSSPPGGLKGRLQVRLSAARSAHIATAGLI
jgi:hypothetical protein